MPDPTPSLKWYCLRSQPKHEHIAAAHLRLLPNVEVFCPRVRHQKLTKRGVMWFVEALFPNYLFARFEPEAVQVEVKYAKGVAGIVRFGMNNATMPDAAIADLRRAMDETELKTVSFAVNVGDAVEIIEGPLRGQTGVVQQLMPAKERVKLLLEFLGGGNAVDLSLTSVFKPAPRII